MDEPAEALLAAVEAALPAWVERSVAAVAGAAGIAWTEELAAATAAASAAARVDVGAELRALLAADVDRQASNPLTILRAAVRFPAGVLAAAGVPPVRREAFRAEAFPDDDYDLAPATWRDIGDDVHEPGIIWGAWKAKTVLDRRRAEGRR